MEKGERIAAIADYMLDSIVEATTKAGSGHPSSAASLVHLVAGLMFGGTFRANLEDLDNPDNDRLILSGGHTVPVLYAAYLAAGFMSKSDFGKKLRQAGSNLPGHPTPDALGCEVATGSLGQGIGVAVGMAMAAKLSGRNYHTYVFIGDSEFTEGANFEAMLLAQKHRLHNLTVILNKNELGQTGHIMDNPYHKFAEAAGFRVRQINGHNTHQILESFALARATQTTPGFIIANTVKGWGIPHMLDGNNWHGKPLPTSAARAFLSVRKKNTFFPIPEARQPELTTSNKQWHAPTASMSDHEIGSQIATREAFGEALAGFYFRHPNMVILDCDVGNSTHTAKFAKHFPHRFVQMYLTEQATVSAAVGLSKRDFYPVFASFGAFLTRATDQLRMAAQSGTNMLIAGTHAGCSVGEDGGSQMALEDIAIFRSLPGSTVMQPADAVAAREIVMNVLGREGITYLRLLRDKTPIIYEPGTQFPTGGCAVIAGEEFSKPDAVIVASGVTVHEALEAEKNLRKLGVKTRVIDCYCLKPLSYQLLSTSIGNPQVLVTAEDHYQAGGLGEIVASVVVQTRISTDFRSLFVPTVPMSGPAHELRKAAGIDANAIFGAVDVALGLSG